MNRIQLTKNLFLDEYIPRDMYMKYAKNPAILMSLIDERLVRADQKLRDHFGPVTINNWWIDGDRQYSGLRTAASPDFSPTSQHAYGRASDKIYKVPATEVRRYIMDNWLALGITRIEDGVSWVHSDVGYTALNNLVIFTP